VTFAIDTRVLSTLIATCMASVVVFGLVPAMQGSRIDVNGLLKEGGRSGTGSRRARFWSAAFLTVEFALTLVLLANVSMDLQREFLDEGPGLTIDPAPLLTARLTLPAAPYATPEDRRRFYARLNEAVGHLAGVVSMTTTNRLPPDNGEQRRLRLAGRAPGDDEGSPIAIVSIGPRYFETLGIPVIAGRDLLDEDSLPGREGVVVNQRLADRFFQGQGAIGQRVQIVGDQAAKTTPAWHTIVGIAPDVRQGPLPMPTAYVPDEAPPTAIVIVRTQSSPDALGPVVRSAVAALDDNLPLYRVVPLAVARHESSWNSRVSSDILHTITLIALLLAVVGLYGVTAHAVAQRTREIGIRVALGATARRVAWLVLRRALAYVGFGLAVGLLCTYVFERLFVDATVGPPLTSPRNLAVVVGLVMIVAVVACIRPASRAAHVEPVTALRAE
jgi:predicted permease